MPEAFSWNHIFEYKEGSLYWRISSKNNLVKAGDKIAEAIRGNYAKVGYKYKTYLVHRIVWELHNGPLDKGKIIDHINGNGRDNRIENLRAVSYAQNSRNRKVHRMRGTVRPFHDVRNNTYRASINLGSFKSEEEAQEILNQAYNLIRRNLCHVQL